MRGEGRGERGGKGREEGEEEGVRKICKKLRGEKKGVKQEEGGVAIIPCYRANRANGPTVTLISLLVSFANIK